MAVAAFLTLIFNSGSTLFHSSDPSTPAQPICSGITQIGLFCVVPDIDVARWIGVIALVPVLAGIFPPVTALIHWYVTASIFWTITPMEGGDQLATIVTFLLIPVCLCDTRTFVWGSAPKLGNPIVNCVGKVAMLLICGQLAVVYLNSAISKFSSPPWVEGSALWYWVQHPAFGAPTWLKGFAMDVLATPVGVAGFTWGSILLELFIVAAILVPVRRVRVVGLLVGVLFHLGIAIVIGLVTFSTVMIGVLVIVLLAWPLEQMDEVTSDTDSDEQQIVDATISPAQLTLRDQIPSSVVAESQQ